MSCVIELKASTTRYWHLPPNIDKCHLYVKDPFYSKYQFLVIGREKLGSATLTNPIPFIDYSQTVDIAYENLEDHNQTKNGRVITVFDDVLADMKSKKKLSPTVTELLFLRGRNSIFHFFLDQNLISKCLRL